MITTTDISRATAKAIKYRVVHELGLTIMLDGDRGYTKEKEINNTLVLISTTILTSNPATINANLEEYVIDIDVMHNKDRTDGREELSKVEVAIRESVPRSIKIDAKEPQYIHIDAISTDYMQDEIGWRLHIALRGKFLNILFVDTANKDIIKGETVKTKILGTEKTEILDTKELMSYVEIENK